jgi:hypothetical protein
MCKKLLSAIDKNSTQHIEMQHYRLQNLFLLPRFEVLTTVRMMMVFWVVMPCKLAGRYRRFGEAEGLAVASSHPI